MVVKGSRRSLERGLQQSGWKGFFLHFASKLKYIVYHTCTK